MAEVAFSSFRVFTAKEHLNPKYKAEITQHFVPTVDNSTASISDEATLASHLESLTDTIMRAQIENKLNHEHILRAFCSPSFSWANSTGGVPCIPDCDNLEDHIRNISAYKATHPEKKVGGVNYTTKFTADGSVAFVTFALQGYIGPGAAWRNRESVSCLHWRKRESDGSWECWQRRQILGGGLPFP